MSTVPNIEILCKHKDANASNLNEVFASYGCSTLEAKVPVVDKQVIEQVQTTDSDQQVLATLALKSESASWAMKGRAPRTRNKDLRVVEVSGEVMLEAGVERERSPVDRGELDDDLEAYVRERERIKEAKRLGLEVPEPEEAPEETICPSVSKALRRMKFEQKHCKQEEPEEIDQENWGQQEEPEPEQEVDLDGDLDRYMAEAKRKKEQRRLLVEQTDRLDVMMRMEEDDD